MSALVMVCKSDRVELLSDAAYFDPATGAVGAIYSKLAPMPELNCVMCGRGPIPVMWITAYVAGLSCRTFDGIVADFATIRAEAATYRSRDIPAGEWTRADIGLVGWSESRDRPEGYMCLGRDLPELGFTAGNLTLCDAGLFADGSREVADAFVENVRTNPEGFDPEADGVAVMELMRRDAVPLGDEHGAPVGHSVGGYVELATVTRDGLTVRTIHTWPDQVGKRITPSPLTVRA